MDKTLYKIVETLKCKKAGDGWLCHCPSHDDSNPSLYVTYKDNKILFHCHAGCSQEEVLSALKRLKLWPGTGNQKKNSPIPRKRKNMELKEIYAYKDLDGNLIGYTGRYEAPGEKEVIPFFIEKGNKWKAGLGDYKHKRPWYGIEYIYENTRYLLIVEGEKCVDAFYSIYQEPDWACISWQGGSKAIEHADMETLFNAIRSLKELEIYLWPDADFAGVKAMETCFNMIKEMNLGNIEISVFNPLCYLREPGWDLADLIAEAVNYKDYSTYKTLFDLVGAFNVKKEKATTEVFKKMLLEAKLSELSSKYNTETRREVKKQIRNELEQLWVKYLNQEYAVVLNGTPVIFDKKTNQIVSIKQLELKYSKKNFPFNPVTVWFQSPACKYYEGLILSRQALMYGNSTPDNKYNLFHGWAVEPKPGPCDHILQFIYEIICSRNDSVYNWILDWLAHLFQTPENKAESTVAIVLQGPKGVGKSFFVRKLLELTEDGENNYGMSITQTDKLFGRFKEHLVGKILIVIDELKWASELKKYEGQLKDLITGTTLVIEPKGRKPFVVQNLMRFIICSDEDWIIPATVDERRFTVLNVSQERLRDYAYFTELDKAWKEKEKRTFLHFLLNRSIKSNLREPVYTEAFFKQIIFSMQAHESWIFECFQEGIIGKYRWEKDRPTRIPISEFYQEYIKYCHQLKSRKILSKQALKASLEKFLKHPISSTRNKKKRYYILPPRSSVLLGLKKFKSQSKSEGSSKSSEQLFCRNCKYFSHVNEEHGFCQKLNTSRFDLSQPCEHFSPRIFLRVPN